ncbi:PAS domain S-box protein [Confluentibacter flavum]|uniref:histidine kinase n=1 Tax=Confluentibacter flavum TaxID=1909700 RepID=A0A2N3HF26_9FLAO|nr:PAS domain S-box protein [Confluentibacter flavum]PKQ43575.1 hypothetical protein CSW08_16330 [Confluentibacter flavum]
MHNNLRILHLEDEPSDALLVSHALKQVGFKFDCLVVDSKEKFLEALDDFDPDLILADHSLPSFNSFEALELLGSRENKIPVILVTATMSDEFAVNAIKRGAKDYVLKDRLGRLPSAIKNVLETQQLEKEREGFLFQLQQNERKFRRLIENGADAVAILSPDGTPSYVTPSLKKVLGYSEKEALELNIYEIIHENQRECVQEKFLECVANPQTTFDGYSLRARHKNGSWRWLEVTLTSFIEDSAIEGIVADFRDVTDRKLADKALKESNIRYELVSKATSDAIYEWDVTSNVLVWGEAFHSMFGYSQEEFSSTIEAYLEKIHPDEKNQIIKSLNSGIEGKENRRIAEYRLKKADGKYASVIEKGTILRDENGKALRMVGAIQDVSEKEKLEELLDETYRFARIGSFEIVCEKNSLYWSPVTKEIHEVDMDYNPTLEEGILFYKEGKSRDAMSNAYSKALTENLPYDLELQVVTAKGNVHWVRKIGRPTFVDGKCVQINGSFQDITKIKNSELEALKASEEKEIILESIGDAFFMVDTDWKVTYWNRHSEKLLECTKEEILGKNLWDVYPDAIGTKFYTSYQKAVRERSIEDFVEYFERADKWFEVTAYPSKNGLSVYFKDVTERKQSDLQIIGLNKNLKAHTEELVEANKGLEQFSFIVSHNLRSPVANILGLVELIGDKDYQEEEKNSFLKALFDNVKRLDTVISDLNAILQVKVEMDAKKETVVLEHLVDTIKSSIQNLIDKEKVHVTTHFDIPAIDTVQSYLHSIFYNLITNSIKYRRQGVPPRIEIRSEIKEGTVIITFEDNGLGIDLIKKEEQVFGLYKRFHHHIEGKGMGLFLVKTQVELLGGKISVESEVNKGTKFTITFKEKTLNNISDYEKTTLHVG